MQDLFNQDSGKDLNHDSLDVQAGKDFKSGKSHQSQKSRFRLRFRDDNEKVDEILDLLAGDRPALLQPRPMCDRILKRIVDLVETFINGVAGTKK